MITNFNLNELTIDTMSQWSLSMKCIVLLSGFVLLLGVGYWIVILSTLEDYRILEAKESILRRKFELIQHQTSNALIFRSQVEQMTVIFQSMLQQFSSKDLEPGLLDNIYQTGINSGLLFESFTPLPEKSQDFYNDVPIKMVVWGNYPQFILFLNRVTQLNHLVTWHDFDMTRASSDHEKSTGSEKLVLTITAKIYTPRISLEIVG